jgi:hypothetical protein
MENVHSQVQLLTRFSQWLEKTHTKIYAVDEAIVDRFLRCQQRSDYIRRGDAAALHRFLRMLRERGATRRRKKPPLSSKQQLVNPWRRTRGSRSAVRGSHEHGSLDIGW